MIKGQIFENPEVLRDAVKAYGEVYNFKPISKGIEDKRWVFICNKGLHYRCQAKKRTNSSTTKTGCKFRINFAKVGSTSWRLSSIHESHNHDLDNPPKKFMSEEQLKILEQLRVDGATPRDQLLYFLHEDPQCGLSIIDIYNANKKNKKKNLNRRTPMEAVIDITAEKDYHCRVRNNSDGQVTHLLLCHPEAITYLLSWPQVLIMDRTYKTNRFNRPLFYILSKTPFNKPLTCGSLFTSSESECDYLWVLQQFKEIVGVDFHPDIIVTDRDSGLINAVSETFPTSTHLLRRSNITKDVEINCKNLLSEEDWKVFNGEWNALCNSEDEIKFEDSLKKLELKYSNMDTMWSYLKNTLLDPWKDRFISFYVDKTIHFGTTTTNAVESSHAASKKFLKMSTGDLLHSFQMLDNLLTFQYNGFKDQLKRERQSVLSQCRGEIYQDVVKRISKFALMQSTAHCPSGSNGECLNQIYYFTMGFPCSHFISELMERNQRLKMEHFNPHWWIYEPQKHQVIPSNPSIIVEPVVSALDDFQQSSCDHQVENVIRLNDLATNGSNVTIVGPSVDSRKGIKRGIGEDPSSFEIMKLSLRHCSKCGEKGHNARTCLFTPPC